MTAFSLVMLGKFLVVFVIYFFAVVAYLRLNPAASLSLFFFGFGFGFFFLLSLSFKSSDNVRRQANLLS